MKNSSSSLSRRQFGKTAGLAASAAFGCQILPRSVFGANERPALVGIGSGGKGVADIGGSAKAGFDIVGLVDVVDARNLEEGGLSKKAKGRLGSMKSTREKYPDAKFYTDYRQMITDLDDKFDAVTVSTPDHHHFHATYAALKAGKHAYTQKPLTHGIWEARVLTETAAATGLQTQMGNQAHANSHMRRCIELIRSGILGEVKEIHAWTNRPIWPQGFQAPPEPEPVPAGIDWEQWIGPAPWVDYNSVIAPFAWRGWWNYGTGAMGDMACHIMDMPYWALELGAPTSVQAKQVGASELSPPINSTVTYDFAEKGVKFHWYDGQKGAKFDRENWRLIPGEFNRPSDKVLGGFDYKQYGALIVGDRAKMYFHRKNNNWVVTPGDTMQDFKWPAESIPRARDEDNYKEWLDAIQGKVEHGQSYFGLAGPFTEVVLLGTLAQRVPNTKLEWDSEKMEVKGKPELKKYIQREYRAGWEVEV